MEHATPTDRSANQQLLKDLRTAVGDLAGVDPWAGLTRFISLGCLTIGLSVLSWHAGQIGLFVLGAIATSIAYAFWLICNHDATHRSLTGWAWFDTLMPRLISWPMLWPVGTYNQLHQLHHGWNGIDLRDPERVQWTAADYQASPAWQRWYVRHQWVIDIFILGGIGLIGKTFLHGLNLQEHSPHLRKQMLIDLVGMVCMQGILISFVAFHMLGLWKYLLFWIVLERGAGFIVQVRDHLEHYGLWHQTDSYQLTQLYACRNLQTPPWVNWLMGGLPYHAVHHAFPQIPYSQLPEAFKRIQDVLQRYGRPPMVMSPGYIATSLQLSACPELITPKLTTSELIAIGDQK
ncbi:MAG: fatty acid desaturase [Phormidesmis sp.]